MVSPYDQNYMNGVNMAFKVSGIQDDRIKMQMMQQIQQQNMVTQMLEQQRIKAELDEKIRKNAMMQTPVSQFMKPGMKTVPVPDEQGGIMQQPTGRPDFQVPPDATLEMAERLMNLKKAMAPDPTKYQIAEPGKVLVGETPGQEPSFTTIPGTPIQKLPSLGNPVEITIERKFLDSSYNTDPAKRAIAMKWLNTQEGREALQQTTKETTAERVTFLQSSEGYVPGFSSGVRVGQTGQETKIKKGFTPEMSRELADFRTTSETMNDIYKNASKMKDKFGPIEGRWTALKQKFINEGATQTVINEVGSLITIAYALSGKQISEREMELLKGVLLPRLEQPYENFESTLKFSKDWLARMHNNRLQYYKGSGYEGKIEPISTELGNESDYRKKYNY